MPPAVCQSLRVAPGRDHETRWTFGETHQYSKVPCSEGLPLSLQIAAAPFAEALVLRIAHAYLKETTVHDLQPNETLEKYWPLDSSFGWYDLAVTIDSNSPFERRLAGHVETGRDSMSDPAIAASGIPTA